MTSPVDNTADPDYQQKIQAVAAKLEGWEGPIVVVSHVDPDGDAVGSSVAMHRALRTLGKTCILPIAPPTYLAFLLQPEENVSPLEVLPDETLLLVLDISAKDRILGAPLQGAAFIINLDHHATIDRFGDLAVVDPTKAAAALIVKDVIEAMGLRWTPEVATPCLTGLLTDTGMFRFGNTSPDVLQAASELIDRGGVDYPELVDRLQWRHPDYFTMLGRVMTTAEFPLAGRVVMVHVDDSVRQGLSSKDDSSDIVDLIRYAEGTAVAIVLRELETTTKVSVRTKAGVSAQAICLELGGGGHLAAAGARLSVGLVQAKELVLAAVRNEFQRSLDAG